MRRFCLIFSWGWDGMASGWRQQQNWIESWIMWHGWWFQVVTMGSQSSQHFPSFSYPFQPGAGRLSGRPTAQQHLLRRRRRLLWGRGGGSARPAASRAWRGCEPREPHEPCQLGVASGWTTGSHGGGQSDPWGLESDESGEWGPRSSEIELGGFQAGEALDNARSDLQRAV